MKPIKIKLDCKYKDTYLYAEDIVEPIEKNWEMIEALNRGGFIEPLTRREIEEMKKPKIKIRDKEE